MLFNVYICKPQVFDYMVDSETHEFVKWSDICPPYNATPHIGIPPDAFVHSTQIEQIMTILGKTWVSHASGLILESTKQHQTI